MALDSGYWGNGAALDGGYWESGEDTKVLTNADHIRSMTDEELAYLLHSEYFEGFNKGLDRDFSEMLPYYKDWLKQPYKEDT